MMSATMQDLSGDEQRQVLGEVLADKLDVILEYVREIPDIKEKVNQIDVRLVRVEKIVEIHEVDIRQIRRHLQLA